MAERPDPALVDNVAKALSDTDIRLERIGDRIKIAARTLGWDPYEQLQLFIEASIVSLPVGGFWYFDEVPALLAYVERLEAEAAKCQTH